MAETVTNRGKLIIATGGLATADLRMCVFTGTQTGANDPDLNTVSDLDAVTSIAIHSQRVAVEGVTVTEDDVNNRADVESDDVVFTAAAGVTAQGVGIYVEPASSPSDATRDLVAVYTTNFPQPMDGGLTVQVTDLLRLS